MHYHTGIGDFAIISAATPVAPNRLRADFVIYGSNAVTRFGAFPFLYFFHIAERDDLSVWDNKKYMKQPVYTKSDESIKRYRAWYQRA